MSKPQMPESRIEYDGLFGRRMFPSVSAFRAWRALPWWKRWFL